MKQKAAVTAEIVRIGNSKGVRIPKAIREQIGLEGKVTLTVVGGALMIQPKGRKPREGWAEAFAKCDISGPDDAIWPDMPTEFDKTEWTW